MAVTTYTGQVNPIIAELVADVGGKPLAHAMPKKGIKKGQPAAIYDDSGLVIMIYSSGEVHTSVSSGTEIKVKKDNSFYVGGKIYFTITGYTISAIDTSHADYDTLTVGTIASSFVAGNVYYSDSTINPNCFITDDYEYDEDVDGSAKILNVASATVGVLDLARMPNKWDKTIQGTSMIKTIP